MAMDNLFVHTEELHVIKKYLEYFRHDSSNNNGYEEEDVNEVEEDDSYLSLKMKKPANPKRDTTETMSKATWILVNLSTTKTMSKATWRLHVHVVNMRMANTIEIPGISKRSTQNRHR